VRVVPAPSSAKQKHVFRLFKNRHYTDDWHAYGSLRLRGNHVILKKGDGKPKGRDHINSTASRGSGAWPSTGFVNIAGCVKRFPNLQFILQKLSFRFNNREYDIFPLILRILKNTDINEMNQIESEMLVNDQK